MLEMGLPRLGMSRSFLQELSRAVSRSSRGPVAGNHPEHFFDPTGSSKITTPDRIENNVFSIRSGFVTQLDRRSADADFLQLGPWRSGKQLWIYIGQSCVHSEARKANFHHFRGKSLCERIEMYFFNGMKIQLHKNWPNIFFIKIMKNVSCEHDRCVVETQLTTCTTY